MKKSSVLIISLIAVIILFIIIIQLNYNIFGSSSDSESNNIDEALENQAEGMPDADDLNINQDQDEVISDESEANSQPGSIKEFSIIADEKHYDPETIIVNKGDPVKITFNFNDEDIYFGGLDIKSDYFTVKYRKSDSERSKTVEFTAENSFSYTGYWPGTSKRKATGYVSVL